MSHQYSFKLKLLLADKSAVMWSQTVEMICVIFLNMLQRNCAKTWLLFDL